MDMYYIVLIVLALAITIMYVITQICDTIKEIFKNTDKIIKNNKNCQIRITQEKVSDKKNENTKDIKKE